MVGSSGVTVEGAVRPDASERGACQGQGVSPPLLPCGASGMRGDAAWQHAFCGQWRLCASEPTVNGMPHYVHVLEGSMAPLHLYHLTSLVEDVVYPKWVIGPAVGGELGWAFCAAWAPAPHASTAAWSVRVGKGWYTQPHLTFHALEHEAATHGAALPPQPAPFVLGLAGTQVQLRPTSGPAAEAIAPLERWLGAISPALVKFALALFDRLSSGAHRLSGARLGDAELRKVGLVVPIQRHSLHMLG